MTKRIFLLTSLKKNLKELFCFSLLLIITQQCFSIDSNVANYYPLKIGNSWTNRYQAFYPPAYGEDFYYKRIIVDTVRIDSRLYFKSINTHDTVTLYIRIDELTGNLMRYSTNGCEWLDNEMLTDSLASRKNDYSRPGCIVAPLYECNDTSNVTVFGFQIKSKNFRLQNGFQTVNRKYAIGIGLIQKSNYIGNSYSDDIMRGCVINGIVYGDTSTHVGIVQLSNSIPTDFQLSQNYPNPFNPVSKIRFSIKERSFAQIAVYDITGRFITFVLNENMAPGEYETEFDGAEMPSGVYFYRMTVDGVLVDSRKMILLK